MSQFPQQKKTKERKLRRGWTTGACAAAATKAALELLLTGRASDPVTITLPNGSKPTFKLAFKDTDESWARTGIIKDAGDDPDVTNGALIISTVRPGLTGSGLVFKAGHGVGTITKAGLPLSIGEPAINPAPRRMIQQSVADIGQRLDTICNDLEIEISVPDGIQLAKKTWNPKLGIIGGISILGTTGVVQPFSCAAWIHSIHRCIDVARANGLNRIAASTGSTSEIAVSTYYNLPNIALINMGDFAGRMLKYLRNNPVPNIIIAGGIAKICKLAQGHYDLHSTRSQVDFQWLSERSISLGASKNLADDIAKSNTAMDAFDICCYGQIPIASNVATFAQKFAKDILNISDTNVDVMIVDRTGNIIANTDVNCL